MTPRGRLILAAAAFLGWLGYLGYAAALKSRDPIISRAQDAAAQYVLVVEVEAGEDGKPAQVVKVVESRTTDGPAVGSEIFIGNLHNAQGFTGPGQYLLLLEKEFVPTITVLVKGVQMRVYNLVGHQRSPGTDLSDVPKPLIYRWTDDVRKQADSLRR